MLKRLVACLPLAAGGAVLTAATAGAAASTGAAAVLPIMGALLLTGGAQHAFNKVLDASGDRLEALFSGQAGIDENHHILWSLRAAHLKALETVLKRFDDARRRRSGHGAGGGGKAVLGGTQDISGHRHSRAENRRGPGKRSRTGGFPDPAARLRRRAGRTRGEGAGRLSRAARGAEGGDRGRWSWQSFSRRRARWRRNCRRLSEPRSAQILAGWICSSAMRRHG